MFDTDRYPMPELAVIVPTFNERENVLPLLSLLETALTGIQYEVIFVDDDSPDGTAELVRSIARENPRVRVVHRVQRRGLASACIEGMMACATPYLAVMDADLQHDERILPQMLAKLKAERLDLVIGSRNVEGGSMGDFTKGRVAMSQLGRKVSRIACKCDVTDPMSGFFMLTRTYLEEVLHSVSAIGFKILVDLLASADRPVRFGEVPYRFRTRVHGESKLDTLVLIEYAELVLDKLFGNTIPARFFIFGGVGMVGAIFYALTVFILFRMTHIPFVAALIIATFVAMSSNFFLNNAVTYRDRRLKGAQAVIGLVLFYLICSVGAFLTISMAELARQANLPWYAATAFAAVISSVWNFAVSQVFTWGLQRRRRPAAVPLQQRA
jgi:dolichol-phosphate mannosyltransferase